jgi:hypothetical protein
MLLKALLLIPSTESMFTVDKAFPSSFLIQILVKSLLYGERYVCHHYNECISRKETYKYAVLAKTSAIHALPHKRYI